MFVSLDVICFVAHGTWRKFKKQSAMHLIVFEQCSCWPSGNYREPLWGKPAWVFIARRDKY